MQDVSREYSLLFNALSDAEEALDLLRNQLIAAQQQAEELYLEQEDGDRSGEGQA